MFIKENDYYREYQNSMFGITKKKGGWDCLRHYEIIANKCLPYFEDFDKKPPTIMTNWPAELQKQVNNMVITKNYSQYNNILSQFFSYCKNNLTTEHLAKYILSKTL